MKEKRKTRNPFWSIFFQNGFLKKEQKQNKRSVVRRNLPRSKRITRVKQGRGQPPSYSNYNTIPNSKYIWNAKNIENYDDLSPSNTLKFPEKASEVKALSLKKWRIICEKLKRRVYNSLFCFFTCNIWRLTCESRPSIYITRLFELWESCEEITFDSDTYLHKL